MHFIVVKIHQYARIVRPPENENTGRGEHKNGISNAVRAISHTGAHCAHAYFARSSVGADVRAFRKLLKRIITGNNNNDRRSTRYRNDSNWQTPGKPATSLGHRTSTASRLLFDVIRGLSNKETNCCNTFFFSNHKKLFKALSICYNALLPSPIPLFKITFQVL